MNLRTQPMRMHPAQGPVARGERGSITVLFVVFALIVIGAVTWSLYVGQQVSQRIRLQNAVDAGGLATVNHAAQGLNMMAGNNLAIGASIHIAGAMPILASYVSLIKLIDANLVGAVEMAIVSGVEVISDKKLGDVFQRDVWDKLKFVPGLYMQAASGTTRFNRFMAEWWMIPAPVRTLEITRANAPGAVVLPMQSAQISMPGVLSYRELGETTPRNTICHAVKSSRRVGNSEQRDNIVAWLTGPGHTIPGGDFIGAIAGTLGRGLEVLHGVLPVRLGFTDCGYGLKVSLHSMMSSVIGLGPSGPVASVLVDKVLGSFRDAREAFERRIDDLPKSMCNRGGLLGSIIRFVCKVATAPCSAVTSKMSEAIGEAESTIRGAISNDFSSEGSFAQKTVMYRSIVEMHKPGNKSSFVCEDAAGVEHVGHVPLLDDAGNRYCQNIDLIRPYCVFRKELGGPIKVVMDIKAKCDTGNPGANMDKFLSERDPEGCLGMVRFEQKGLEQQYKDHGIEIASFGKQAEAFVQGKGGAGSAMERSLAFVIPKIDRDEFVRRNGVLTIAANPLRTADQLGSCPAEFQATNAQGEPWCMQTPMIGLGRIGDSSRPLAADPKINQSLDLASGGLSSLANQQATNGRAHSGALASTLARTQWSVSQVDLAHVPAGNDPAPKSFRNTMFLPAWRSRLVKVRPSDLAGALKNVVGPGDSSTPAVVSGLQAGQM